MGEGKSARVSVLDGELENGMGMQMEMEASEERRTFFCIQKKEAHEASEGRSIQFSTVQVILKRKWKCSRRPYTRIFA